MFVFKRKQVVVAALVALIGVAGYLNWTFSSQEYSETSDTGEVSDVETIGEVQLVENEVAPDETDFFTQARLDRDESKSKAQETLNTVIANKDVERMSKEAAEQEMINMAKSTAAETSLEGLIKAKGFTDAVVYITDGKASVLVKTDGLSQQDVAKIQDIIITQLGIASENIKIVEVK